MDKFKLGNLKMSDRRFKVSKSEESNHYRYNDLKDDDKAKEKLLPSNDRALLRPSGAGKSIKSQLKVQIKKR